ncbi:MAG: helix-hairpin-helix domain-containing protein [Fusobacterium sp.]|nr:helix-hairpin-helix domain-containing protein [Fusobacterium sp.]
MYRIIFYVIALIISLLIPDSRYNRYSNMYGRRRYNRVFNYFEDDIGEQESDGLAGRIRAFMRRRKALKQAKKFVTRDKYIITLRNQNVIFVMDTENKTMSCVDNKVKGRAATVVWAEQVNAAVNLFFNNNDNIFEQTFDTICISFNERANYSGIVDILKARFNIHESNPAPKPVPQKTVKTKDEAPIKLTNVKRIDINAASEHEIAKLPGISIIIAKKIIKYRTLHNGFKTLDEFYREMKIKPHFQEQLNDLICIYRAKNAQKTSEDERIIDF